jgi:hypothetical protein
MKSVRYVAVLGLVAVCFAILGRLFYLDSYYYSHAPRQADVASGIICPINVHHGTTVYLSVEQWRWFESPISVTLNGVVFLASACGAYVLNRRWKLMGP